jgi:hypothetical protein
VLETIVEASGPAPPVFQAATVRKRKLQPEPTLPPDASPAAPLLATPAALPLFPTTAALPVPATALNTDLLASPTSVDHVDPASEPDPDLNALIVIGEPESTLAGQIPDSDSDVVAPKTKRRLRHHRTEP